MLLEEASPTSHLKYILEVDMECSWPKIWDLALDRGPWGTSCAQAILKVLGLQSFTGICPFGSCEHNIMDGYHLGAHFLSAHTNLSATLSDCATALKSNSDEILSFGHTRTLQNSFKL